MGSVVRRMRRRKRSLGEVRVLRREEYQGLELNAKVELIRSLIPLGLMHVQMALDEEVEALAGARYAALFLDGKSFADATLVIALGVTVDGSKRFLGFVETDTENDKVLAPFLRSLIERGLDLAQGLLVVIDGGKGLRSAVRQVFQKKALVQRCMWHKRENVVSYLAKSEQASWRRRLQHAYDRPSYTEAKAALTKLHRELEGRNQSAAASLAEGLEETLTLHRLGVYELVGVSFKTTNCIESANVLVEERCAKVDSWKTSNQRRRWLATALLDVEPRLRRVRGCQHLPKLQSALRRVLSIKVTEVIEEVA